MDIICIIYLIISIYATICIWQKYWAEEYDKEKSKGNVQDAMACMFIMFIFIFWPIFVIKELVIKIIKKIKYE